ncbi:Gag-Pol polyprotein [Bienertia sinuspersici]
MIQQEESQREIFKQSSKDEIGGLAMSSKKGDMKFTNCGKLGQTQRKMLACKVCGKTGHSMEDCWWIKGFPDRGEKGKTKPATGQKQQFRGKEPFNKSQ